MKTLSYQKNLSDEAAERVLSKHGFKDASLCVEHLSYRNIGYGHYKLKIDISSQVKPAKSITLTEVAANKSMIVDWNKSESYFNADNTGHWYDNSKQVMESAFDVILNNEDNLQGLKEFITE